MLLKNSLIVFSNDIGVKLFTLNQVIDEVIVENYLVFTFPGIFCKLKVINQREVIEHFAESTQCKGAFIVMLRQEGQNCWRSRIYFYFKPWYYIQRRLKGLSAQYMGPSS